MIEHSLCFWLEKEGYDVTYISNVDTHADGLGLLRSKVFLSVGHDEYWTKEMFANVTQARDAGVNLAFLSGNSVSGQVELRPSTDGRPNRVMRRIGDLRAKRTCWEPNRTAWASPTGRAACPSTGYSLAPT